MSNFIGIWILVGGAASIICLAVAVFWGFMSRADERDGGLSDSFYKQQRKVTRCWFIASVASLIWPLVLPAAVVYAVVVTIRYAFPRESEG